MAVTLTNRETVRDALYDYINDNLKSTTLFKTVWAYPPAESEVDGQTPIVWLGSLGSNHNIQSINEKRKATHKIAVTIGVMIGGDQADDLSDAEVEDKLDLLMKETIEELSQIDSYVKSGTWLGWDMDGDSVVGYTQFQGIIYRIETFVLNFYVSD